MRSLRSNWAAIVAIGVIGLFVKDSLAVELGEWTDRSLTILPPPVWAPEMVFSEEIDACVFLGGQSQNGTFDGETWAWDGSFWSMINSNGPARGSHAMAYDANREVVVMFGGGDSTGKLGDTWEWDGMTWTQVDLGDPNGVSAPLPRAQHGMAFDRQRGVVVLFGGSTGPGGSLPSDETTWEWDGASWTKQVVPGPSARGMFAIAYDDQEEAVVIFGGTDGTQVLGDTWIYDGTAWVDRTTSGPSARRGARMAYDSHRGVMMLFGGNDIPQGNFGNVFDDTWEWDGNQWVARFAGPMTSRHSSGFAYDRTRGALVLAGGSTPGDVSIIDTWELIEDCNTNGVHDSIDIAGGSSIDCNENGIPDECELDFDADGLIDDCDPDVDDDGVPNLDDVCDFTPFLAIANGRVILDSGSIHFGTILGDLDGDCDCDLMDYSLLAMDVTGPNP